jgi:NAD-dependent dihydropyrimidine dehydrogenase PreA subunit
LIRRPEFFSYTGGKEDYVLDGIELRKKIDETLEPLRPLLWGVCDMDQAQPYSYGKVLTIGVPFSHMITLEEYSEPFLRSLHMGIKKRMKHVAEKLSALFQSLGADFIIPGPGEIEAGEIFEKRMTATFSTKEAGRMAGLGWIGKNNLLVTKEFGPRLHMLTILLNEPLTADKPIERSYCGACDRCYRNCPFHALKNKLWEPRMPREEQIDYVTCSHSRLAIFERLGRKIACAKCIASCPNGTANRVPDMEPVL